MSVIPFIFILLTNSNDAKHEIVESVRKGIKTISVCSKLNAKISGSTVCLINSSWPLLRYLHVTSFSKLHSYDNIEKH